MKHSTYGALLFALAAIATAEPPLATPADVLPGTPDGQLLGSTSSVTPSEVLVKGSLTPLIPVTEESDESTPPHCAHEVNEFDSAQGLATITDCEYLTGSLILDRYTDPVLDLGSVAYIAGDFRVVLSNVVEQIIAPGLVAVGGTIQWEKLRSLTSASLPRLALVGVVDWRVLPVLTTVHHPELRELRSLTISDTALVSVAALEVDQLEVLNVNNNRFLESLASGVRRVSHELLVLANAERMAVRLPQLVMVNNITLNDIWELELGHLEKVMQLASFVNNKFASLRVPRLKEVGGTLSISRNKLLTAVEAPVLTETGGGLVVMENTLLSKLSFFPKLQVIGGAIEFTGNFREASMARLKMVKGSAVIQSTVTAFNCSPWTRGKVASIIRGGRIECQSGMAEKDMVTYESVRKLDTKSAAVAVTSGAHPLNGLTAVLLAGGMWLLLNAWR